MEKIINKWMFVPFLMPKYAISLFMVPSEEGYEGCMYGISRSADGKETSGSLGFSRADIHYIRRVAKERGRGLAEPAPVLNEVPAHFKHLGAKPLDQREFDRVIVALGGR